MHRKNRRTKGKKGFTYRTKRNLFYRVRKAYKPCFIPLRSIVYYHRGYVLIPCIRVNICSSNKHIKEPQIIPHRTPLTTVGPPPHPASTPQPTQNLWSCISQYTAALTGANNLVCGSIIPREEGWRGRRRLRSWGRSARGEALSEQAVTGCF